MSGRAEWHDQRFRLASMLPLKLGLVAGSVHAAYMQMSRSPKCKGSCARLANMKDPLSRCFMRLVLTKNTTQHVITVSQTAGKYGHVVFMMFPYLGSLTVSRLPTVDNVASHDLKEGLCCRHCWLITSTLHRGSKGFATILGSQGWATTQLKPPWQSGFMVVALLRSHGIVRLEYLVTCQCQS